MTNTEGFPPPMNEQFIPPKSHSNSILTVAVHTLLKAFGGDYSAKTPSDTLALAQVYATLEVAAQTARLADVMEAAQQGTDSFPITTRSV